MTYKDLLRETSYMFKISQRDILGRAKYDFILPARFAVWKALHNTGTSYAQIGRWFDRDHTTVRNGVRRAGEIMEYDHDYRAKVRTLTILKQGADNDRDNGTPHDRQGSL